MAFEGWYPMDSQSPGDGDAPKGEEWRETLMALPDQLKGFGFRRLNMKSNLWHLDGTPWHEARMESRWKRHRHKTQTIGFVYEWVERCRCGARRYDLRRTWIEERADLRRKGGWFR